MADRQSRPPLGVGADRAGPAIVVRPPRPGVPFGAEARCPTHRSDDGLAHADASADRWAAVVGARLLTGAAPAWCRVAPPTTVTDELRNSVTAVAGLVPGIATLLGIEPPVPGSRQPRGLRRPTGGRASATRPPARRPGSPPSERRRSRRHPYPASPGTGTTTASDLEAAPLRPPPPNRARQPSRCGPPNRWRRPNPSAESVAARRTGGYCRTRSPRRWRLELVVTESPRRGFREPAPAEPASPCRRRPRNRRHTAEPDRRASWLPAETGAGRRRTSFTAAVRPPDPVATLAEGPSPGCRCAPPEPVAVSQNPSPRRWLPGTGLPAAETPSPRPWRTP